MEKLVAVINAKFLATVNAAVIGSTIGNTSTAVSAALLYAIRSADGGGQPRSRTHANEDHRCRSEQCYLFHHSALPLVTYQCKHIRPMSPESSNNVANRSEPVLNAPQDV
jgi:hypothetical protein